MRNVRLWRALLGVDRRTVIEDIEFDQQGADGAEVVVARVRPRSGVSRRCGRCGRRAPWYDRGAGRRRWRGLDWGTVQVVLEADAPRVNCPAHGAATRDGCTGDANGYLDVARINTIDAELSGGRTGGAGRDINWTS